ncbi:MAG: response regulator [Bacteroidetes bacterium]|nr:response regulator [Bacteroidota bacterium]
MKRYLPGLLALFLLVFLNSISAYSQSDDLEFEYLGKESGLSNLRITSILQDDPGYIWIGTVRGLFRYNGYQMKVYKSNPMDSTTLEYHQINCMIRDRDNELWIGSMYGDRGLSRYNREKDNFQAIDIPARDIYCLDQDENGYIWIGTGNGLFRYIKEENRYETYHFRSADGTTERMIYSIHCFGSEILINIAELGVFKYDSRENDFSPMVLVEDCNSFDVKNILEVFRYNQDIYWLGTDQGLLKYEKNSTEKIQRIRDINGMEIHSRIECIVEESYQHIWIGADGVYRYNILENELTHMDHQPGKSRSLASNLISCAYKDRQDNLWIGTAGSGINIWNQQNNRFIRHAGINSILDRISGDLTTLAYDDEENLWIGTRDKGIVVFDRNLNQIKDIHQQYPALENLKNEFVRTIEQGPDKKIWIGSTERNFTMIDPVNKENYNLIIEEGEEALGEKDMVTSVQPDGENRLWVGTGYNGLLLFDTESRKFIDYEGQKQMESYNITDLEKDSRGTIWIATHKNGVFKMEPGESIKRQVFDGIPLDIQKRANFITIYEGNENNLWFGTEFLGLIKLTPEGQSQVFDISQNLETNEISSISEDSYERLWIATTGGLARFEKSTNTIKHYNWRDGMASDEFNYNSSCYGSDNIIFLGGTNGLVSFVPETIRDNEYAPSVLIEALFVGNREVEVGEEGSILTRALSLTEKITLKYSQNDIGFEIVALNLVAPAKNHYQYKLEGFNPEWIDIGNRRRFDFTNLRFGSYTLHIKGSNNDQLWSKESSSLNIRILPPFWLTWWALIIYLLLTISLIYVTYREIRHRIRLKNQVTRQNIEQQHQEDMTNMKIQFFTNISHEFKIPLSLIISPIEEALQDYKGPTELRKKLQLIRSSAARLLRLVTLLIDFRKAEQDVLSLKKGKADLLSLCSTTVESFRSLASRDNKLMEVRCDLQACIFEFDMGKIERVLYNLIDNALRHTTTRDEIIVSVSVAKDTDKVILEVKDTGTGIPEEEQDKIFDKFYQAETVANETSVSMGSGIGLYICRKIIELHDGEIKVKSEAGQGTAIIITLPARELSTSSDGLISTDSKYITQSSDFFMPTEALVPPNLSDNAPLVLIIEDHKELADHIQKLLWNYYRTEKAYDGKEGLELARKIIPDLIISDIMMPEMDGILLCKKIKGDSALDNIPIILLSAKSDMESKLHGFELGADDFIEKPFLPQHLQSRVHNLIRSREKLKARFSDEKKLKPKMAGVNHVDREFLEKAFYKIEQNIGNSEYHVNELSMEMGLSRVHFYRRFKELTSMTPKDYFKETRLKEAVRLLEEDQNSISEIAYMIGFNTPSSFTVAFKGFYGVSPKEYKGKK